jgi:hypothetical protein
LGDGGAGKRRSVERMTLEGGMNECEVDDAGSSGSAYANDVFLRAGPTGIARESGRLNGGEL